MPEPTDLVWLIDGIKCIRAKPCISSKADLSHFFDLLWNGSSINPAQEMPEPADLVWLIDGIKCIRAKPCISSKADLSHFFDLS
jgi:hypothetical protein